MIVVFPMKLPSVANQRLHWAVKAKQVKAQRNAVALLLRAYRYASLLEIHAAIARGKLVRVTLRRSAPRKLDDDNLSGAFKAIRDEVAKQLGTHDGPDGSLRFVYEQETWRSEPMVMIGIEVLP